MTIKLKKNATTNYKKIICGLIMVTMFVISFGVITIFINYMSDDYIIRQNKIIIINNNIKE